MKVGEGNVEQSEAKRRGSDHKQGERGRVWQKEGGENEIRENENEGGQEEGEMR